MTPRPAWVPASTRKGAGNVLASKGTASWAGCMARDVIESYPGGPRRQATALTDTVRTSTSRSVARASNGGRRLEVRRRRCRHMVLRLGVRRALACTRDDRLGSVALIIRRMPRRSSGHHWSVSSRCWSVWGRTPLQPPSVRRRTLSDSRSSGFLCCVPALDAAFGRLRLIRPIDRRSVNEPGRHSLRATLGECPGLHPGVDLAVAVDPGVDRAVAIAQFEPCCHRDAGPEARGWLDRDGRHRRPSRPITAGSERPLRETGPASPARAGRIRRERPRRGLRLPLVRGATTW